MRRSAQPIRILTVDDHGIFRQGIAGLLADEQDVQLVAEASSRHQFRAYRSEVTLMDPDMPEMPSCLPSARRR